MEYSTHGIQQQHSDRYIYRHPPDERGREREKRERTREGEERAKEGEERARESASELGKTYTYTYYVYTFPHIRAYFYTYEFQAPLTREGRCAREREGVQERGRAK